MRASVTSLSKKIISTFFACALAVGLMPATAFAIEDDGTVATMPTGEIINQVEPLEVVAQQESTQSYFLAKMLEDTRVIPMVSAKLPVDSGQNSGELDSDSIDSSCAVSSESTVLGSFEYFGMTFAFESDGASVALMAVDNSRLPEPYVEEKVVVVPECVTPNGIDRYSVERIADDAFAGLVDITIVAIPASSTVIEPDAFSCCDTLQYVVVASDNSNYSSYDGCLYDKPLSSLLLIPEGRTGAVCVSSNVTSVDSEVFSHCPSVSELVTDADGAAFSTLVNAQPFDRNGKPLLIASEADEIPFDASYDGIASAINMNVLAIQASKENTDFDEPEFVSRSAYNAETSSSFSVRYQSILWGTTVYASTTSVTAETDDSFDAAVNKALAADSMLSSKSVATKIRRLYHYNGRIIYENEDGAFKAFGFNQNSTGNGGVIAVICSYSADGSNPFNIPTGPYGMAVSGTVYLSLLSEAESSQGFSVRYQENLVGTTLYGSTVALTKDTEDSFDMAVTNSLTDEQTFTSSTVARNVQRFYHYNGRVVYQTAKGFKAFGFNQGSTGDGGVAAVICSYSKDGSNPFNIPTGPYGLAVSGTVYVSLLSKTDASQGFSVRYQERIWDTTVYNSTDVLTRETEDSFDMAATNSLVFSQTLSSRAVATNIQRLYHYNGRLIYQTAKGSKAFGLKANSTGDGGVAAVICSYSADGSSPFNIPTGPYGMAVSGTVYVSLLAGVQSSYSISWDGNGGTWSSGDNRSIAMGSKVAFSSSVGGPAVNDSVVVPERPGYKFYGWASLASAAPSAARTTVTPTGDMVYYAIWGIKKTVMLDQQGADDPASTSMLYYVYGTNKFYTDADCTVEYVKAETVIPKRDGYAFDGYYQSSGEDVGAQYIDEHGAPTSSVTASLWDNTSDAATIYAKWTLEPYTIVYEDANGNALDGWTVKGGGELRESFDKTMSEEELRLPEMEKRGYAWMGWTRKDTGAAVASIPTDTEGDVVLVANFTATPYTIEVKLGGGQGEGWSDVTNVTYDQPTITLPTEKPKRAGYVFQHFAAYKTNGDIAIDEDLVPGETYTVLGLGNDVDDDVACIEAVWTERIAIDVPAEADLGILADFDADALYFRSGETSYGNASGDVYAPLRFISYTTVPVGIVAVTDEADETMKDTAAHVFGGEQNKAEVGFKVLSDANGTQVHEFALHGGKTAQSGYLSGLKLEAAESAPAERIFYLGMTFGDLKPVDISFNDGGTIAKLYYTVALLKDDDTLASESSILEALDPDDNKILW